MTSTSVLHWGLSLAAVAVSLFWAGRLLLRERRAAGVRAEVSTEPVLAEFPGVRVQMNPGSASQTALKSAGFGIPLVVRSHSFQVGSYFWFRAPECDMAASRERFGFRQVDCLVVSGEYGGSPIRLALHRGGWDLAIWRALETAGVRPVSGPPT